jgi:hypothetical protein
MFDCFPFQSFHQKEKLCLLFEVAFVPRVLLLSATHLCHLSQEITGPSTIESNNPHGWLERPNPSTPIQKKSPGTTGALERKALGGEGLGGVFRSLGQLTCGDKVAIKMKRASRVPQLGLGTNYRFLPLNSHPLSGAQVDPERFPFMPVRLGRES